MPDAPKPAEPPFATRYGACGPTRATSVLPYAGQTHGPPIVTLPFGPPETLIVPPSCRSSFVGRLRYGSTLTSAPRAPSATHTPRWPAAIPVRSAPRGIVRPTALVLLLMRVSDWSSWFPIHAEPKPSATGPGRAPTGTSSTTLPLPASITATEFGKTFTAAPPPVSSATPAPTATRT